MTKEPQHHTDLKTMSKKLTLSEKKLVSEHVTGETKRCLGILKRLYGNLGEFNNKELYNAYVKEMIEYYYKF